MTDVELEELTEYARQFSGFTFERQDLLIRMGPTMIPVLPKITDAFYEVLLGIPKPAKYLQGRVNMLKQSHIHWLTSIFTGPFDLKYAAAIHHAGEVHVRVELPMEFMAGGMTLIGDQLIKEIEAQYADDSDLRAAAHEAVNAVLGFSLIIMQQALMESTLKSELEKFMKVTGISRPLFNKLAAV